MVVIVFVDHFGQVYITALPAVVQEKHVKLVSANVIVVVACFGGLSEVYGSCCLMLLLSLRLAVLGE